MKSKLAFLGISSKSQRPMSEMKVRATRVDDLPAVNDLYTHYVLGFDTAA